jgi:predicted transcriptional regulator
MTTIELKRLLIHRISEINELWSFIDSKTQTELYVLSEEQLDAINNSLKQYKQGLFIEQEDLDKKVAKWASEE